MVASHTQGPEIAPTGPAHSVNAPIVYLIRNSQQELVAVSNQADVKASIVITATAIVIGVAGNHLGDGNVRWSLATLGGLLLVSMFLAVLAVVPKHRTPPDPRRADHFNPLFFGHFTSLAVEEYLTLLRRIMQSESSVYDAQLRDLHARGQYIERHKLRYVRWSYLAFFLAFLAATTQQVITVIVR